MEQPELFNPMPFEGQLYVICSNAQHSVDLTFNLVTVHKNLKSLWVLWPKTFVWVCHFHAKMTYPKSSGQLVIKTGSTPGHHSPKKTNSRGIHFPDSCGTRGALTPKHLFPSHEYIIWAHNVGHHLLVISQEYKEEWKLVFLFKELLGYWWLGSEGEWQKNQL